MKNLLLSLAFMLIGSVVFANSDQSIFLSQDEVSELTIFNEFNEQENIVVFSGCSSWTTFVSCGVTWYSCNSLYASIEEQWAFVEYMHNLHCTKN